MSAREFQLIESGAGLPDYPWPRDFRLPTHFFFPWHHARWLNSRMHLVASYEAQGVALALYCLAQMQAPIGTLPDDDELLARMLRLDLARWRELRRAEHGPMTGWYRVNCEGEVRWAHPVVIEVLDDIASRRERREQSKDARARDRRIDRMRHALSGMGVSDAVLSDRAVLEEIETYLSATHHGNRTVATYTRALRWAADQGILNGGGARAKSRA